MLAAAYKYNTEQQKLLPELHNMGRELAIALILLLSLAFITASLCVPVRNALIDREVLVAAQARDLLALLGVLQHRAHSGVQPGLVVRHAAKTRMRFALLYVPIVQLLDICAVGNIKQK